MTKENLIKENSRLRDELQRQKRLSSYFADQLQSISQGFGVKHGAWTASTEWHEAIKNKASLALKKGIEMGFDL